MCRVYWGSHGCHLVRGHDGHHLCCCDCVNHPDSDPESGLLDNGCVGAFPFYGPQTRFYGEDVSPTELRLTVD